MTYELLVLQRSNYKRSAKNNYRIYFLDFTKEFS